MLMPNARASAEFQNVRETLYATGFNALATGDDSLALRAFGLMAAMSPLEERPWLGLGVAHEQSGRWELAAGFYRMARQVAASSVWPLVREARALGKLGKLNDARALLDRAESLTNETTILNQIEKIRGAL